MNKSFVIVIGLVLLASLLLFSTTYTVKYYEVGIKTRFGQAADSIITQPGLGFKFPRPIDNVITLDTRLQMIETPLETVQTADGQQLAVLAFMLWRIDLEGNGPLDFYNNYKDASLGDAMESLRNEFRTQVKRGVSKYRFTELIGADSRITEAESFIMDAMASLEGKGVVPEIVGFRQMSLPAKTTNAVIARMNKERKNLANLERNRGSIEAQRIRSLAGIDADKIRAFANQRAEEIRSQGDAVAATYLSEMSQDEELAIFLVWIDALEKSLSTNTTFILPSDVAPWHLMDSGVPRNAKGIPQPDKSYGITPNGNGDRRVQGDDETTENLNEVIAGKGPDDE